MLQWQTELNAWSTDSACRMSPCLRSGENNWTVSSLMSQHLFGAMLEVAPPEASTGIRTEVRSQSINDPIWTQSCSLIIITTSLYVHTALSPPPTVWTHNVRDCNVPTPYIADVMWCSSMSRWTRHQLCHEPKVSCHLVTSDTIATIFNGVCWYFAAWFYIWSE
jgi:hypothetical protein